MKKAFENLLLLLILAAILYMGIIAAFWGGDTESPSARQYRQMQIRGEVEDGNW
jgi:hypothetical protein